MGRGRIGKEGTWVKYKLFRDLRSYVSFLDRQS